MDSFTIRCEVNNDWDFSTKEENVAMVNGNPVRPYQRKYLGNKTKLSISTTISFHFLSHLIIVTGPPTQPKESVFIENHPVRFECQVGRFQPKTALLTYEWSIVDSASEIVPADKLLNIMANKTVHLISSNQHSSRIEILVNREMHKKILRCTVHSQLKRPVNLNESGPPVVTSSASLELKILYGPRIKRQETTYVPIRLPNPEEYTGSDHLVFPDDESGFWNSTTLAWLECETDSNPPAHISWYFRLPNGSMQLTGFETRQPVKLYQNGNLLPALSKDYVSTVSTTLGTKDTSDEVEQRSSQEEHILRGLWNFTCEAYSSGFPRQRASRVVGLADVPMLTGRNQVFVRIGQAVELQCDIRSLPAPFESSIQWNFHAILFKEDPRSLHLFTLSSAAVERYGTSDANILEVHQLLVNRQWMITNEEVVLGWISRLRIQHVTEKHFGLYNCSARNELGGGWHITLLRQAQGDGRDLLKNRPLIDRQEDNFQPSNNSDFSRSQAISQRPQRLSMAHQMLSFNNRSSDTTLASSYDLQHWTRFHASATRNTQKPRRIKYGEECKRAAGRISSLENQPCNIPQLLPSAVKEK
ncbi:hypothetical protein CSKR_111555 [Clonorchis sinensis]|uniref:Ig-like domain-containing protein n=1 Tax=Clonorchis sinensis TaxID=79923 RepID=A0A8T1N1A6_CLOSI|nr:hypothetical protein CSKR_111555 [Clonorchis sinensis]